VRCGEDRRRRCSCSRSTTPGDTGDLAQLDFLAASADPLAIEAVGLGFLPLAGANERLMKRAADVGVGANASERIHLLGRHSPRSAPPREIVRLRVSR